MDYELVITDVATKDLQGTVDYIARRSIERAKKYHEAVIKKLKLLTKEPYIGKPHAIKKFRFIGYRELVIESHVATYSVNDDKKQVNIIRVLHGAMDKKKNLRNYLQ